MLVAYWLPQLFARLTPSASALIMLFGLLSYQLIPNMPEPLSPLQSPRIWELVSEIVVIIVLFTTGLRIDKIPPLSEWGPTIRLLAIAMPLTIFATAFLGWQLAGMTIAGAITLGAVLAPTDPVLARDVQVGPPKRGREDRVRFTLTTEAGLNDGLAFPFVYLGIAIAAKGTDSSSWLAQWITFDLFYRIVVGTAAGCLLGWTLGKASFVATPWRPFAETGPGLVALAGTFMVYGLVELIEGYGFLAVFFAGLFYRRQDEEHELHDRMHVFGEAIEQALTAFLLFALGSMMPLLWGHLDWRHSVIGFGLIFFIRPVAAAVSLIGNDFKPLERFTVSFLGIRGIGSIFYMGYAAGHIQFVNNAELWALVAYTIFASAVIHGTVASLLVRTAVDRQTE